MDVMITGERGVRLMCETEGCASWASTVWYGAWHGKPVRACERHNPMANTAMALPTGFTSHPLCHACGQPVQFGG
jgi:hypothetical protein